MIKNRKEQRDKRHFRIRKRIFGTSSCPRVSVFVSNKNFYAQVIDDQKMHTLCSYSSKKLTDNKYNNIDVAMIIGQKLAQEMKKNNIEQVVFDRGGFLFHGKIKAFAQALRKNGVKF